MSNEVMIHPSLGAIDLKAGLTQPNVATGVLSTERPYVYEGSTKGFEERFPSIFESSVRVLGQPLNVSPFKGLFSIPKITTKDEANTFLYLYQCVETYRQYSISSDPSYKAWVDGNLQKAKQLATNDGGLQGIAQEVINKLMTIVGGLLPPPLKTLASVFKPKIQTALMNKLAPYIQQGNDIKGFAFAVLTAEIKRLLPYQSLPITVTAIVDKTTYDGLLNTLCTELESKIKAEAQEIVDDILGRSDPTTQLKKAYVSFWESIRISGVGDFASRFGETRTLSNVVFNNGQDLGDYIDLVGDEQISYRAVKPFAYVERKSKDSLIYDPWNGATELFQATLAWAPNLASSGAISTVLSGLGSSRPNLQAQVPKAQAVVDSLKILATSADITRVERMNPFTTDKEGNKTGPLKFVNNQLVFVMSGPKCLRQTYMELTSSDDATYIARVVAFRDFIVKYATVSEQNRQVRKLEDLLELNERLKSEPSKSIKTKDGKTITLTVKLLTPEQIAKMNADISAAKQKIATLESEIATLSATYADLEAFRNTDYGVLDQLVPYLICPSYTSMTQTDCGTSIDQSPSGLLGRFCSYLNAVKEGSLKAQAIESRNRLLLWVLGGVVVGGGGFYLWKRHQKKKAMR